MTQFKNHIILILTIAALNLVYATDQEKEIIIVNNDTCYILETPLDSILKDLKSKKFDIENTSCWRGYVGTWRIRDSALYLIGIDAKFNGNKVVFEDVMQSQEKEIPAKWYSGKLTIVGTNKYYIYPDIYAPRIELIVANGKVLNTRKIEGTDITKELRKRLVVSHLIFYGSIIVGMIALLVIINYVHK